MGHGESTHLTSSAKSAGASELRNVATSSYSRVHSSPSLRKVRRKGATHCASKPDRSRPDDSVMDSEISEIRGATSTLPSDVELSSEVIVSTSVGQ